MAKELSWRALLIVAIVGLPEPTLAQSQGAIELLQQLRAEVAQVRNEVQPRRFYVTQDAFRGEHALNACTAGFHMASLWEIFDVTTLKYDTQLGRTLPDSGEGPPAGQRGWIRTGGWEHAICFWHQAGELRGLDYRPRPRPHGRRNDGRVDGYMVPEPHTRFRVAPNSVSP